MKEQNYKQHILGSGVYLDKLQQGDFDYTERYNQHHTLSEYAKQVRKDADRLSRKRSKIRSKK